jgi:hypothetical protein
MPSDESHSPPFVVLFITVNFVLAALCALWLLALSVVALYGVAYSGDEGEKLASGLAGCALLAAPTVVGLPVYLVAGIGLMRRRPWGFWFHCAGAVFAAFTCLGIAYTAFALVIAFQARFYGAFFQSRTHLSEAQLWGLAAGGILTRLNSEHFDRLSFECGPIASRDCLREWWGVNDTRELNNILDWLWHEGHSKSCLAMCESITKADGSCGDATLHDSAGLGAFVSFHLTELQNLSLVGWDLCRLINVARWGYTAGFIPSEEAWSWILPSAERLQQYFGSWNAVGRNFMLGYEFWCRFTGTAVDIDVEGAHTWLVNDPNSPWCQMPWDTRLSG